jgi:hypothetical protein
VAALAALLPVGFRDRQKAEWTADLTDLASAGAVVRWRYLMAALWTLPKLRSLVRSGEAATSPRLSGRSLRTHLGRPGTSGIVVLASLVALLGGAFGAGATIRIGWELGRPLPTGVQAEDLKRTIFPGLKVAGGGDAPYWRATEDSEDLEFGAADYAVGSIDSLYTRDVDAPVDAAVAALIPGIPGRLTATGWRIQHGPPDEVAGPGRTPTRYTPLRATRDGLILTYPGGESFSVARAIPPWLDWFAAGGALLGGLCGWFLTAWAGRRAELGSAAAELAGLLVWPTTVLLLLSQLGSLVLHLPTHSWRDVVYLRLLYLVGGTPRWAGVIALLAVGIVLLFGRPATGVTQQGVADSRPRTDSHPH